MEKVLILTTHFPPSAHVGAKRIAKFCKYLPQYGWLPIVVTRKISQYHLLDETLNDDLQSDLEVYRVGLEIENNSRRKFAENQGENINPLRTILRKIYDSFLFYDYFWLIRAFIQAFKIIRKNKIRVVFTTYPNAEPIIVGLLLKILLHVKWICEFRDPWTHIHYVYSPSFFQKYLERFFEIFVLYWSDQIVTIGENMKKLLSNISKGKIKDKICVIYNGYDTDDFSISFDKNDNSNKLCITCAGTWGTKRSPEFFLRCLDSLFLENKFITDNIRVRLIGEVKFDPHLEHRIFNLLEKDNLKKIVEIIPFLQKKEALYEMARSDVLLLIERPPDENSDNLWVVTSKIFEYIYLKKPILALVPRNGEAAHILEKAGVGVIVDPISCKDIKEAIYLLYNKYVNNTLSPEANHKYIESFSRKKQSEHLVQILDKLVIERNS